MSCVPPVSLLIRECPLGDGVIAVVAAEMQRPVATVVIRGLVLSPLLTLLVTPALSRLSVGPAPDDTGTGCRRCILTIRPWGVRL
jgi:hypothetical protein